MERTETYNDEEVIALERRTTRAGNSSICATTNSPQLADRSKKLSGAALVGCIPHSTTRPFARNDPMTMSTRWPRFTARVGFAKAIQ